MKRGGDVVKYINIIAIIFVVLVSLIMINIETAFEGGIIMIVTSLVMMVLNAIEIRKLYKVKDIEKFMRSMCIIFIWLIFAIIAGLLIYNAVLYSDIMRILEK